MISIFLPPAIPLCCFTASSAPRMPSAPPAANGPSSVASSPIFTVCCAYAAPANEAMTAVATSVRTNVLLFICCLLLRLMIPTCP